MTTTKVHITESVTGRMFKDCTLVIGGPEKVVLDSCGFYSCMFEGAPDCHGVVVENPLSWTRDGLNMIPMHPERISDEIMAEFARFAIGRASEGDGFRIGRDYEGAAAFKGLPDHWADHPNPLALFTVPGVVNIEPNRPVVRRDRAE